MRRRLRLRGSPNGTSSTAAFQVAGRVYVGGDVRGGRDFHTSREQFATRQQEVSLRGKCIASLMPNVRKCVVPSSTRMGD
jgi:hypothetical protein